MAMVAIADGLWNEYQSTRSPELKRKLMVRYLDLVRFVAGRFAAQIKGRPQGLEQGDLMQCGMIGLLEAIDRFSPAHGVKFETFAAPRIRGAILDELRELDWVPRSVRAASRRAEKAAQALAQRNGREALASEIAQRLSITLDQYHELVRDGSAAIMPSHEAGAESGEGSVFEAAAIDEPDPHQQLTETEARSMLIDAIEGLPERERTVITLYYFEGLRFGEIGRVLRVSESRISQIHSEVLRNLRMQLGHVH
jgi:RNA polymerase sigma factor FliA